MRGHGVALDSVHAGGRITVPPPGRVALGAFRAGPESCRQTHGTAGRAGRSTGGAPAGGSMISASRWPALADPLRRPMKVWGPSLV